MIGITFELKKEHVALLKGLRWGSHNRTHIISTDDMEENPLPFAGDNIYDSMYSILYGTPPDFNPLNDDLVNHTPEQIAEFDKLLSELPMALEIILQRESFELGTFRTKHYDKVWKKIN